ncbi:hypothetical protein [Streptomyces sp. NPDC127072]|uniref:hypothetical protein n=1 Tax=Streptomyces sp. NPDC127072 TaxID=3347129 RepID=UPI0036629BB0
MAKITRNGGVSEDATLPAEEDAAAAESDPAPPAAADQSEADVPEQREDPGTGEPMQAVDGDELTGDGSGRSLPPVEDEGGEESSPGSSSSASTETPPPSSGPSEQQSPKPARTTGSRSGKGRTTRSSAPSADGDQTAGESETDGKA